MADILASTEKPLGKMHLIWLRRIAATKNGRMGIMGYDGTPWGNALHGLMTRGLVDMGVGFESGLGLYHITDAGRSALQAQGSASHD